MTSSKLYFLPLAVFLLYPITFIVTYCIAVLLGHTEPDFPYISDTGARSPESCIFSQALNLAAFLTFFTFYLRYRQIAEFYRNHSSSSAIIKLNNAALVVGSLASFGISLAANFQETNVLSVHIIGAILAFGGGTAYLWLQALCSYHTHPLVNTLFVAHMRLTFAIISTIAFFLGSFMAVLAHSYYHGDDPRKWYPGDGGWVFHVISTVSEWVCAVCFDVFILSFVDEFKNITIDHPQVYITIESLTANQYLHNPEVDAGSSGDLQAILSTQNYDS